MNEHRYILETGSKKQPCPECGQKRFVRYMDSQNGEHLPEQYGRCDREINCAYHLNPYNDGYSKMIARRTVWELERGHGLGNWQPAKPIPRQPKQKPKPVSFIPVEVFRQSRKGYGQNNFVHWLTTLFGSTTASELISRYHIGTSKHWEGANVFWQIDQQGLVRSGKIMLYSPATGKRVKEPFNHITWVHKALKLPEFNRSAFRLQQCLFGEHLLHDNTKSVALVESEKTAIIASVYLPQFLWLAVGSLSGLTTKKCKMLAGRTVYLFPDLNAYEKWNSKAKELFQQIPGTRFEVSDLLEMKATETERTKGLDLVDYLTRFYWKTFRQEQSTVQETPPEIKPELTLKPIRYSKIENLVKLSISPNDNLSKLDIQKSGMPPSKNLTKPHIEEHNITKLETFFAGATLPAHPVKLDYCTTITDVSKFIENHLSTVKANNGKQAFLPYLNRLQELKLMFNSKFKLI